MKSVCSYYRNRVLSFLRDTVRRDGWEGDLNAIRAAEADVREDSTQYNTLQIRSHLEQLVDNAENQQKKLLQDIHQALQDQAGLQREIREEKKNNQCLKDLYLTDPVADMERIERSKDLLLTDAYGWLRNHPNFSDWRDGGDDPVTLDKGQSRQGQNNAPDRRHQGIEVLWPFRNPIALLLPS